MSRYVFPKWSNALLPGMLGLGAIAPLYIVFVVAYGFSPQTTDVGYQPAQPIPFSHALHAGELGMDCRYCHNTVERGAGAAIPPTQTCMNCHAQIRKDSELLIPLRESYETGVPVEWIRVHDLPDYAYFDHSAHVNRGIGCVSCHGRIDKMEVVYQHERLSMGWCLECHREPDNHIRGLDQITDMTFDPAVDSTSDERQDLLDQRLINPSENCSTCHR